jgi:hypothetical protein
MRKITILLLVMLLSCGFAYADAVDKELPASTDNALKAHTRAMIKAGVDAEKGLNMTRAMLRNQYQNQHIIQAQKAVMKAARQGVPPEPVMNKAHEGMAKNVPPDQVVQAMVRVQSRYATAFNLASHLNLNTQTRNRMGNLTAEAMTAGMTEEAGNRIMQQLQVQTRAMNHNDGEPLAVQTMTTAREMVRLGVDAETAAEVVCLALQNQFQAQEMIQLRQQFRDQAHEGDPQQLAHQFAYNLQQGSGNGAQGNDDSGQGGNGGAGNSGSGGTGAGGSSGGGSNGGSGGMGSGGIGGSGTGGTGSGGGTGGSGSGNSGGNGGR